MEYNEKKFAKLSLADLIALESYMQKRRAHWISYSREFPDDQNHVDACNEHHKACVQVEETAHKAIADLINDIFPDYEF